MKISDLKLNDTVEINGFDYHYKGVQKIRKLNFGVVQQIVFERNEGTEKIHKYFNLSVESREVKQKNGKLIFK